MRRLTSAIALLIIVSACAASAAAGQAYTVTVTRMGGIATKTFRVIASGDRLRALHVDAPSGEGVMYDILMKSGDSGLVALNTRNQTWYPSPDASPFALDSGYLNPQSDGKIKNLSMTLNPEPAPAGEHRYSGEIRYDVIASYGRHSVKVSCRGTFTVRTADKAPRQHWIGRILPKSLYPEVDAQIRALEARIEGFPVKLSLDAKRTYAGGAPMVDSVEVAVSEIGDGAANESDFVLPTGYRLQEPVVAVPGVMK